jgi:hypothetical protein
MTAQAHAEQAAEAYRGRHFGFACVKVFPGGPGSLAWALSLSIIWAASIGRKYHGKEFDIQEGDETQSSERQGGARAG